MAARGSTPSRCAWTWEAVLDKSGEGGRVREDELNNRVTTGFPDHQRGPDPPWWTPFNFATPHPAPTLPGQHRQSVRATRSYVFFRDDTIDTYDSPMVGGEGYESLAAWVNWQPQSIYSLNSQQGQPGLFWRCSIDMR